jgi:alginate O-acetyltransferase complex protein AlgI
MLFNSLTFLYFFAVVYVLYMLLRKRLRLQNILLLVASYVFYGYWDWRFLILIVISTLVDFSLGWVIGQLGTGSRQAVLLRKALLGLSVAVNLSILGFFKYFNFFMDGLVEILAFAGLTPHPFTLQIILPVGISFYTFQTMSYTIDVYRQKLEPTRSLLNFAVFVAFFPQLVAGPIERAVNLLPQVEGLRQVNYRQIYAGLYLILSGYFKKLVIADNVAVISDRIFNNYTSYTGIDLWLGVLAFAIQIYGDFSGYTDIARGVARLLGFELMVNFRLPYFAVSPSDFWQRWHISLSSWLRDYLYIPLGGNRKGELRTNVNLAATMLLGGLWHGAAWNFVLWGAYHGFILILYRTLRKPSRLPEESPGRLFKPPAALQMLLMFGLTLVGWLIFRSTSVEQIAYMLTRLTPLFSAQTFSLAQELAFFTLPLLVVQLYQYLSRDQLVLIRLPGPMRAALYSLALVWIAVFGARTASEFIYFQF